MVTILFFLILILLLILLFLPRFGLLALWRHYRQERQRILLEDALKHLYDNEYHGRTTTVSSLAGTLSISANKAVEVLETLANLGLIRTIGEEVILTEEGKAYALRMVRIHRLWERYLSENTGLTERDWHRQADILEHKLSADEMEKLAERIGNPLFDPHGDPIPTPEGEIPPPPGVPLSEIQQPGKYRIVHVEDEPSVVYQKLIGIGFAPGMEILVEEITRDAIAIRCELGNHRLSPIVAANLSVEPLEKSFEDLARYPTLNQLGIGEQARVVAISHAVRGPQRRRLLDMGITPGTVVRGEFSGPSGDPVAYLVRGTLIALREEIARHIFIEKLAEADHRSAKGEDRPEHFHNEN